MCAHSGQCHGVGQLRSSFLQADGCLWASTGTRIPIAPGGNTQSHRLVEGILVLDDNIA